MSIPFGAFSGKQTTTTTLTDDSSGISLRGKQGRFNISWDNLKNQENSAKKYLEESGIDVPAICKGTSLDSLFTQLIANSDSKPNAVSWGLFISDKILGKTESLEYFKDVLLSNEKKLDVFFAIWLQIIV